MARQPFRRPFAAQALVQQSCFVASVTILPTIVAVPFGAVTALQLGSLTQQIGAQSFAGAASGPALIQQASPLITALLVAGAGGSAICADIGARTIREEIAAIEVLGISPVQRLIAPTVLAAALVAVLLNGLVSAAAARPGRAAGAGRQPGAAHGLPASVLSDKDGVHHPLRRRPRPEADRPQHP